MINFSEQKFSFTKHLKLFFIVAAVLIAASIIALVTAPFGLILFNFDIEFVGGVTSEYEMHTEVTQEVCDDIAAIVKDAIGVSANVTKSGDNGTQAIIKTTEIDTKQRDAMFDAIAAKYELTGSDIIASDYVSSSVGNDIKRAAILASVIAIILILIYISIRFELRSGLAAITGLVFSLLSMVSVYVIFRIRMNMNFIAAALTILGYSINSTIVVFDRIRENMKLATKNTSFEEVVDRSIWQTMRRCINSTVTTLIPVLLLIILSVSSIRNFAVPLACGIVFGTYASICVAGPMWAKLRNKKA
jgi:preprotein translocase SecF subunit